MSWVAVGNCPRCGAPIYSPMTWMGVTPPPANPSCGCFPQPRTITSNVTVDR